MKKISWEAGHGYSGADGAVMLRAHGVRILRRKAPKPPSKQNPDEQRLYSVWVSDAQYKWAVKLLATDRAPLADQPDAQPLKSGMPKSRWGVLPKPAGLMGRIYETLIEGKLPATARPARKARRIRRRVRKLLR